ncbi:epididymal protein 13 [Tamandua tetradactyla]|uniref:epididymal protein 13 n=1 Tax=Tamandua tetradactyla TaxID=48850 RepID=UPI004053FE26
MLCKTKKYREATMRRGLQFVGSDREYVNRLPGRDTKFVSSPTSPNHAGHRFPRVPHCTALRGPTLPTAEALTAPQTTGLWLPFALFSSSSDLPFFSLCMVWSHGTHGLHAAHGSATAASAHLPPHSQRSLWMAAPEILGLLSLQVLNEETNDCKGDVKPPSATMTTKTPVLKKTNNWSMLKCAYMIATFLFVSYNKGDWCYCHYCNPDLDTRNDPCCLF